MPASWRADCGCCGWGAGNSFLFLMWLDKLVPVSKMTAEDFLVLLQTHAGTFAKAGATNEGEWIIKGFIDIYKRIYTISVDTKIVSKVLELLLFPMFMDFSKKHGLKVELCKQQNFYPDLSFTHEASGA